MHDGALPTMKMISPAQQGMHSLFLSTCFTTYCFSQTRILPTVEAIEDENSAAVFERQPIGGTETKKDAK